MLLHGSDMQTYFIHETFMQAVVKFLWSSDWPSVLTYFTVYTTENDTAITSSFRYQVVNGNILSYKCVHCSNEKYVCLSQACYPPALLVLDMRVQSQVFCTGTTWRVYDRPSGWVPQFKSATYLNKLSIGSSAIGKRDKKKWIGKSIGQ